MTLADVAAAMSLKNTAGWNQTETDWSWLLRWSPNGCFAACDQDALVGTVSTIAYNRRVAWIGMVIVKSEYRKMGIGTALLKCALKYLDQNGVACVKLDATPAGKPLYEQLGFIEEFQIERWQFRRAISERPRAAPQNATNLESIVSLDRLACGFDRSELLRAVIESAPELACVNTPSPANTGFALGRRGWIADQLGPWVAVDRATASSLLDDFLRHSSRQSVFVDCLKDSKWAIPLVCSKGFDLVRPLTRMYRGENCPGQPRLVGAVLGPEFG